MKKILAIVLLLSVLLSMVSCQGIEELASTEATATVPESSAPQAPTSTEKFIPSIQVPNALSWDKINAIPVATNEMTSDQLRQICADFMRLNLTFQWTPNQELNYVIQSYNKDMTFRVNSLYAGIVYNNPDGGSGNLYTVMEFYDPETGVMDIKKLGGRNFATVVSNHCSSSCFWSWARVINTLTRHSTATTEGWVNAYAVQKNGFLPVGPYTYDKNLEAWYDIENGTLGVCQTNGEQTIYQSYAAMKMADGLIQHFKKGSGGNANHVQMVAAESHVVKNPDGTINGDKSYVVIHEQTSSPESVVMDGVNVTIEGRVDRQFSFKTMYEAGYIPFTFAEFLGTDPVEKAEASLNLESTNVSFSELKASVLTANYAISNLYIKAYDANGNELYNYSGRPANTNTVELPMTTMILPALQRHTRNGGCRVEIQCRVGTGEALTVFSGTVTNE